MMAEAPDRISSTRNEPSAISDLERSAEQEIAHQHAGLVAPERVGGRQPTAQVALVHDIVMEQRRRMNEFHTSGQPDMAVAAIVAELGGRQRQQRPQALAACGDDVPGQLWDQRHRALHALEDALVNQPPHRHQAAAHHQGASAALFVEIHDDGHG
jgi:hypothetical protein